MSAKEIRKKAMDLLARREHSRVELQRKLARGFDDGDSEISVQLQRLAEEGLQSDSRFAESYLRMRANAGFGPLRIGLELRERGIDEQGVQHALAVADIDWWQRLESVCEKKFGGGPPADLRELAKRQRFLHYRGFDAEQIRELCRLG